MNPISQTAIWMNCHKENCHFNGYVAYRRFEKHFTTKVPTKIVQKYRLECRKIPIGSILNNSK